MRHNDIDMIVSMSGHRGDDVFMVLSCPNRSPLAWQRVFGGVNLYRLTAHTVRHHIAPLQNTCRRLHTPLESLS
jgi:hypothetical protein